MIQHCARARARAAQALCAGHTPLPLCAATQLLLNPQPGGRPRISVRLSLGETDLEHVRSPAHAAELAAGCPRTAGAPPTATEKTHSTIFARKGATLTSAVEPDEATDRASAAFEVNFDGSEAFEEPMLPPLPTGWCAPRLALARPCAHLALAPALASPSPPLPPSPSLPLPPSPLPHTPTLALASSPARRRVGLLIGPSGCGK
eukprot:3875480-Prymnesium_polylepis.1